MGFHTTVKEFHQNALRDIKMYCEAAKQRD